MSDRNKNGAGKGDMSRRVKRKNWDEGWERAFGNNRKGKKKGKNDEKGIGENKEE